MMVAERNRVGRLTTGLTVLFMLVSAFLPDMVRGDTEPPTAWTEDPPQMTSDKVPAIENKDDTYASQELHKILLLAKRSNDGITLPEKEEELVKRPPVLKSSFNRFLGKLDTASDSGRLENSKDNGIQSSGQRSTNVEVNNSLKFLSAQDIKEQVPTEQTEGQQKEVPITSQHSSSDSKTTTRGSTESNTGIRQGDANESPESKKSLADTNVVSGLKNVLSETGVNEPNIIPDTVVVSMDGIPSGDFIQNMLQEAERVLNGPKIVGDPFLDIIERHRADLARGVVPIMSPIDDPGASSGFLLKALGVRHVMPSSFAARFRRGESRGMNRFRRDFPKAILVKANETQSVLPKNVSSKVNDTLVQEKRPAPDEELKISRIGYIIFEKDGKIKEAKEASMSELGKGDNRTEKPLRNNRKKLTQVCRHGNFVHPIGQPPHDAQNLGADIDPSGAGKQAGLRLHGVIPGSDGKVVFPGENEKALGPNSIEVLTIREDIAKGMQKKDFPDWYEVHGNAVSSKEHRHSSVLSAFHVLLITAICILTFVTILYLSSKIRSDNGPRRLNSHTTLFEPNTKYERY